MRKILLIIILSILLFSQEHFAKLEPIESIIVKSQINGKVITINNLEAKVANSLVIRIDDSLDKKDLENIKSSIKILKDIIKINQNLIPILKKNLLKKEKLYKKIVPINATSQNQKDNIFSSFVNAKVQLDSTREKIKNLQNQILSLQKNKNHLLDIISKKNIKVKNMYIYKIYPQVGEFVTVGTPLLKLDNISKAKLTIYLSEDELKSINNKKIYINGKKTDLKFNKIWKIADEEYISSYKAEIILKPFNEFSKLVKVEIK